MRGTETTQLPVEFSDFVWRRKTASLLLEEAGFGVYLHIVGGSHHNWCLQSKFEVLTESGELDVTTEYAVPRLH